MAYNDVRDIFSKMSKTDQDRARKKLWNDPKFQSFISQYDQENPGTPAQQTLNVPSPSYNPNTTYQYGDTWGASNVSAYQGQGTGGGGNYQYNPNLRTDTFAQLSNGLHFGANAEQAEKRLPGYLETRNNGLANALWNEGKRDQASIRSYLQNFDDFNNYDQVGQENTVQAIYKRMGAMASSAGNNPDQQSYSNQQNQNNTYPHNFWENVDKTLREKFWIENLDEFKRRYPEMYDDTLKNLQNIEGVWNETDPESRKQLEGALQRVAGVGVGRGSDKSKLWHLDNAFKDKFENADKVKSDIEQVNKLETQGMSTSEVARQMGISEDQVNQLILASNGQESRIWDYYQLKKVEADKITEPFDDKIKRLDEEKDIQLQRANRQVEELKQDYDTNYERAKKQNDLNMVNARKLAGKYGYQFSSGAIEGLNNIEDQAKNILDDLTKNYNRGNQQLADGISDIMRNWKNNRQELTKASQKALRDAKTTFVSGMLQVQQKYGTLWLQAQMAFAQGVQNFITEAENIYDRALKRQQENLTNLITNVSNLNALSVQNMALRNQKIQQFQAESMTMNREQVAELAQELWIKGDYQKLRTYQTQAVANTLNGYATGAGMVFQKTAQELIDKGYTPQEAIGLIAQSNEFAQYRRQALSKSDNRSSAPWGLYNKTTGETMTIDGANTKAPTTVEVGDTRLQRDAQTQTRKPIQINGGGQVNTANIEEKMNNFIANNPEGSKGGQCWHFTNSYLKSIGDTTWHDDGSYKSKLNSRNSETPQIGAVAIIKNTVFKQGSAGNTHWHTAIVTGINKDGSIATLESNWNNDLTVHKGTWKPEQIAGYHIPNVQGAEVWKRTPAEMTDIEMPSKMTEFKAKSFGFANRMYESASKIVEYENTFMNRSKSGQYFQNSSRVPNWMKDQDQQAFEVYRENFITAVLRQESGAAISPTEFEKENKKYFPLPWDTKETIKIKQRARDTAIKAMYNNAGSDINGNRLSSYVMPTAPEDFVFD